MRTKVYIGASLDGFIAKPDGNIDWLIKYEGQETRDRYSAFISDIDAIVIGRGTFEKILSFTTWPYEHKVFLLSNSLSTIPAELEGKVTIISLPPKDLLTYLSGLGYSNLYIDGGKVIQGFLRADCIDELVITMVPVLIGTGIPLFGWLGNDLLFKQISTYTYTNGLVTISYERDRG